MTPSSIDKALLRQDCERALLNKTRIYLSPELVIEILEENCDLHEDLKIAEESLERAEEQVESYKDSNNHLHAEVDCLEREVEEFRDIVEGQTRDQELS